MRRTRLVGSTLKEPKKGVKFAGKRKKERLKNAVKNVSIIFFSLFLVGFLIFFASNNNLKLVGFSIQEGEQEHSQALNLEFTESGNYEWETRESGALSSLKLSGSIEGNGTAEIYLNDLLVFKYSGENLEEASLSKEKSSPSQEEPLPSEIPAKEFTDTCEETCNLEKLNLNLHSYTLRIILFDSKLKIDEIKYGITNEVQEIVPEENTTIPENVTNETGIPNTNVTETNITDETGIPETNITIPENVTNENITIPDTNFTETNVTLVTEGNATVITEQYPARLGQPVRWKKQIISDESGNFTIRIPKEAENIVINEITNQIKEKINPLSITGGVISSQDGFFAKLLKGIFGLTGRAVDETLSQNQEINVTLEIEDTKIYEMEYETPAPYAIETPKEGGKEVKIIGPETIHYENVLAFTNLNEILNITDASEIKIYWKENDSFILFQKIEDTNKNGIYDYIEWIVPHLSNQTFEITIQPGSEGKDSFIVEGTPRYNYGADSNLEIKGDGSRRALIEFNLSNVPSGAIISNVTLWMYIKIRGSLSVNQVIGVYRLNHSWVEGTGTGQITADGVTWTNRSGSQLWETPGGDFDNLILWEDNITLTDRNTWINGDITGLVQRWVNGTYPNYGMLLKSETVNSNVWVLASSDDIDATIRPKLNITYNESISPIINLVQIPSVRLGSNLSLYANITDNNAVSNVFFELNGTNYSMSASGTSEEKIIQVTPAAKATIEQYNVDDYRNSYDKNNLTYSRIILDNMKLGVKTPGLSAAGSINSVKIKVVYSAKEQDEEGGEVSCSVHWAVSESIQGDYHSFVANRTMQIVTFDVTSEKNWSMSDFNSAEIYINKTGDVPYIHEIWFEVDYNSSVSPEIWNGMIDISGFAAGTYNYTIYSNDMFGNWASQTGNFTILPELILMNISLNDAQGNFKNSEVLIYNENQELELNSSMTESMLISLESGEKDIIVSPLYSSVKKIEFLNASIEDYVRGIIDIDDLSETGNFTRIYALNPFLNSTNLTVTVSAVGDKLYKCKDWNFTEQTCYGEWIKMMNLTPGQEYNFTLSPGDPGFGEMIEITKAEHLDSDRQFISDIYEEVKSLDDVWSETISSNEYVRVTFKQQLTNKNDITLYPKIISGTPIVEVYEKDKTEKIAEFNPIIDNEYNKIYLTNLPDDYSQDIFDLKILNGDVQFDYIVDPDSSPLVNNLWNSTINGPQNNDDYGSAVAVDNNSNIYVVGDGYWSSASREDIYLGKWNSSGSNLWNATLNGPQNDDDFGYDIAVDNNSDIYIVGESLWSSASTTDIYLGKWNSSGSNLWNATLNGPQNNDDFGHGIAIDNNSNIYVTGSSYWSSASTFDIYLGKWNSSGSNLWNATLNGPQNNHDYGYDVAIDNNSNIYVTGSSYWSSNSTSDIYLGKWNSSGSNLWNATLNGPQNSSDSSREIVLYNNSDIYLAGYSRWSSASTFDIYLGKWNSSGSNLWNATLNGPQNNHDYGYGIAIDNNPNIYVAGNSLWSSASTFDIYLGKWNSSGSNLWNATLNGPQNNHDYGSAVAVDNNSDIYLVGYSRWSSASTSDIYLGKFQETGITQCGTLDSASTTYTLTNDVNSSGTCFTITAPNITLDCNGYNINYSQAGGAYTYGMYTNQTNTTIKNCNIYDGNLASTSTLRYGIYYNTSSGGIVRNNNITANRPYAIYFQLSSNNTIINNKAISNYSSGIVLSNSDNNTIFNNFVVGNLSNALVLSGSNYNNLTDNIVTSSDYYGLQVDNSNNSVLVNNVVTTILSGAVYLSSSSNSNLFINNTGSSNNSYGFWLQSSSNNVFINNIGTSNSNYVLLIQTSSMNNSFYNQQAIGYFAESTAVLVQASNDTLFQDCVNISGATDVALISNSRNVTFLNCSYRRNGNNESVGAGSTLSRQWYYRAYVNDTNGNGVPNANVSAKNKTGDLIFSELFTNSSGWTNITTITDYVNNGGTRTYYSNYNMTATNTTFTSNHLYNATSNLSNFKDVFTLGDNTAPNINFTAPTPANGSSQAGNSIYVNVSTSDANDHSAWIDWNRSLLLWLSFDQRYNDTYMYDNSSYGNNGTFVGNTVLTTSGKRGDGAVFDGVDDNVDCGNNSGLNKPNETNQITLMAWIKPNELTTYSKFIVSKLFDQTPEDMSYALLAYGVEGTGNLRMQLSCNGTGVITQGFTDLTFNPNVWTHVAVMSNGSVMKAYVNGVESSQTGTPTECIHNSEAIVAIGTSSASNGDFNGSIDEVMIFSRALTPEEINATYQAGTYKLYRNFTGLSAGQYNFTAYAIDASGNVNRTEQRGVTITSGDIASPNINFTNPTPANGSSQSATSIYVNVSTYDESEHSAFIDFNRSLVGWWNFNDRNSTDVYDNSTWGNFGTFYGGIGTGNITSGRRGNAFTFDGINDSINLPFNSESLNITGNITVSAWIMSNDVPNNYRTIVRRGLINTGGGTNEQYYLGSWSNGRIGFRVSNKTDTKESGVLSGAVLPSQNIWYHVVGRYNGTTVSLYINGEYNSSANTTGFGSLNPTPSSDYGAAIGSEVLNGNYNWNGSIDEVLIFNRYLSDLEVQALYNASANQYYNNFTNLPVGQYNFTAYAIDEAGNLNSTEIRSVTITTADTTPPNINFTSPTPANGSSQSNTDIYVNVSTYDENNHSAWIDWNRSLVGWWNFESVNSSGTVFDNSTWGNNGNMTGFNFNTTVTGIRGDALTFDGINDCVRLGNPLSTVVNTSTGFSISVWINPLSIGTTSFQNIISRGSVADSADAMIYSLYRYPDSFTNSSLRSVISDGQSLLTVTTPANSLDINQWQYFTLVWNNITKNLTLYKNGVVIVSNTNLTFGGVWDSTATSQLVSIGCRSQTSDYFFNGSIDEVMIFSRALTPEEINASYNAGTYKLYNNFTNLPVGQYNFTAYAIDEAGNINQTEQRGVIITSGDIASPSINFTNPTPANGSSQTATSVYVNVSTSDNNDHSTWLDWNRDLGLWISFDERNTTNVYDNSSYNLNGKIVNFPLFNSSGIRGDYGIFNGTNTYIEIQNFSDFFNLSRGFTVSLWLKSNVTTGVPIGHWTPSRGIGLYYTNDWYTGSGASWFWTSAGRLADNQWHIYTATYNGTTLTSYVDGVKNSSTPASNVQMPLGTNLSIGRDNRNQYYFNGSIDEVLIFNRSLTIAEIQSLYNASANQYYNNFTGLSAGQYNFTAYAIDEAGNINQTEQRGVIITSGDIASPSINFTNPTPANGSSQTATSVYVNVSTSDASEHSVFLDWNRSLVGWWNFDDRNSTDVYDNSTWNRHGRIIGDAANYTPNGKRGGAFTFNGTDDYITIGTGSDFSDVCINGCTFSAWINTLQGTSSAYSIIARSDSLDDNQFFSLWIDGDEDTRFTLSENGNTSYCNAEDRANDIQSNQWEHIVGVYNLTHVLIYRDGNFALNGTSCNFTSINQTAWQDSESTFIGLNDDSSYGGDMNGSIDEAMIWNRVLSPQEIKALYNASANQYYNNFTNLPVGQYNFTAYAIDEAGNLNSTEIRSVTITTADTTPPNINFTNPTPANGSSQSNTDVYVNVSTSDLGEHSAFLDWNRSLVRWWNFDNRNSSGDPTDLSSYSGNGTRKGNVTYTTSGKRGGAFIFNGIANNGSIQVGTGSNFSNLCIDGCTFSAWVNGNYPNGQVGIIGRSSFNNYLFSLYWDQWGRATFSIDTDGLSVNSCQAVGSGGFTYNTWNHVVGVYNKTTSLIYTNGVLRGNETCSWTSLNETAWQDSEPTYIGALNGGSGTTQNNANGTIDEVMIFSRVLTPEEINASYNAGTYKLYNNFTGLSAGQYNFTAYAIDASGNVNKTEQRGVTITAGDTEYPQFSNYWDNNGTQITGGTGYFNVTVTSTNGTVILTYNNTNYTATNSSGNATTFNYTITGLTNGTYSYNWTSYGNGTASNYNVSNARSYLVNASDTTAPDITITFPSNNTNMSNTQINVNYTVDSTATYCWYSNDSYSINTSLANCGTNITTVIWTEGTHKVRIYVNDSIGNVNSSAVRFTVDTRAPYFDFWKNMTNGFSTSLYRAAPAGITTNGSDFWIAGWWTYWFIYHANRTGGNITDGFPAPDLGADNIFGITTNGSDFWITDLTDAFVYHTNRTGGNMTDGFSISAIGSNSPRGITTNGSDFWIVDNYDDAVYHTDRNGINQSDGFRVSTIGAGDIYGIASNGSDFWITENVDDFVYHTNRTGGNITDGFSMSAMGLGNSAGITTNVSLLGGSPTDFWIADWYDYVVYHVSYVKLENQTLAAGESLNYTISAQDDGAGLGYFTINWTTTFSISSGTGELTNISALSAGLYEINISVNDTIGNLNSSIVLINVSAGPDTTPPNINFTNPTPANGSSQTATSVFVNVSITESNLGEIKWNWNGTNYSLYDDSLVLMMSFNNLSAIGENSTYAVDVSKYNNNGTMRGTLTLVDGVSGKSYDFGGLQSNNISIPDNPSLGVPNKQITILAWINKTALSDYEVILSKNDVYWFGTYQNNVEFILNDTANYYQGITKIGANVWQCIGATYNGSLVQLYVNGTLDKSFIENKTVDNTPSEVIIGASVTWGTNSFNGSIDEVRIYNRSLSADEVREYCMATLWKYNSTQWYLQINQTQNSTTGLSNGTYTYKAYAQDGAGNLNFTETRNINIDNVPPSINFTNPTPANGSSQLNTDIYVNVSTSDTNNHSAFIDFNRSLVGWWSMDSYNASGIYDNSTWENFGNFRGSLSTSNIITGIRGDALTFDGNGDYINITSSSLINFNESSVCMWVNLTNITGFGTGGFSQTFLNLYLDDNNQLRIGNDEAAGGGKFFVAYEYSGVEYGRITSNGILTSNSWKQVCYTFNSTNIALYVNGNLSDIGSTTYSRSTSNFIGSRTSSSGATNGSIDEVMIFSRALTPEEINASYNAGAYRLYHNFTELSAGQYNFTAYAIDEAGNVNQTEQRTVTITSEESITYLDNCLTLNTAGTYYQLNASIINDSMTGDCIQIRAENITFDCDGYYLTGIKNYTGINSNQKNTTIKNCNVSMGSGGNAGAMGIELTDAAHNSTIRDNTLNNNYYGLYTHAENCLIENNTANVSDFGGSSKAFYLDSASNNTLINNTGISNSSVGIRIEHSFSNNLINNTGISIFDHGISISNSSNINLTNNIGISNSSYGIAIYLYSVDNLLINNTGTSFGGAGIYIASSNSTLLINNTGTSVISRGIFDSGSYNTTLIGNIGIGNSSYGIQFDHSLNATLINNTGITNINYGIYLLSSNSSFLTNNIGISNTSNGILILGSSNNTLINNIGISNSSSGIALSSSFNNTLMNNNGTSAYGASSYGIYIYAGSNDNILINNTGTSIQGVGIYISSSNNTLLINNTGISNTSRGIRLSASSNNNLINNIGTSGSGGNSYGIELLTSSNNNNLTNNLGISNSSYGIYLASSSNNNNLTNNLGISNSSYGIYLSASNNNILTNNIGTSSSNTGFYLSSSIGNTLINNSATSNSSNAIELRASANGNTLINNTAISNYRYATAIYTSENNTFINYRTEGLFSGSRGIYIENANNTLFQDCINVSGVDDDIYVFNSASSSLNNTFVNCSYNLSKELVQGAGNTLIRKWYYRAYVNDTNGIAVNNVNVTAFNSTNNYQFNLTTDGTGYTPIGQIIDYVNTGGTRSYYSDYNITATNTTSTANHLYNATSNLSNLKDVFTILFSDNAAPNINFTNPTPANGSSQLNTDIYVNVSTSDASNHSAFIDFNRSLVGWWNFESVNSSGTVFDNSTWGNNGTTYNFTLDMIVAGIRGDALQFNGVNKSILVESKDSLNASNYMTIAVWVNLAENTTYKAIVSKGATQSSTDEEVYSIISRTISGYTLFEFRISNGSTLLSPDTYLKAHSLNKNRWYFVVGTINGTNASIYLDGVLNASTTDTGFGAVQNPTSNGGFRNLSIGKDLRYNTNYMNGSVDEVMIFNRAFSTEEIKALYNAGTYKLYNNFTGLSAGQYNFTAYAIDEAGNVNQTEQRTVTITSTNNPPQIIRVYNATISPDPSLNLNAGPFPTGFIINFTAYDVDGDLNITTAVINFSRFGEETRTNASCQRIDASTTLANFTCNVTMWWYDEAGAWNITASIWDNNTNYGTNSSNTTFTLGLVTGFEISPTNLTWNQFSPGATNQTANNDPITLNNTGNNYITPNNIQINATNLTGETDGSKVIIANNFSVNWEGNTGTCVGAACIECGGTNMSSGNFANITLANLTRGNFTQNNNFTGQEQLFFCLRIVGTDLTPQAYSTKTAGAWTIRILLIAAIPRKRKKKSIKNEKLLDAFNLIADELKEEYSLNKKELLQLILEKLQEKYKISRKEIIETIKEEAEIPLSIFSKDIGVLEVLTKYMKENLNMNYSEIARELERDERTIWTSYKKANEKQKENIRIEGKTDYVPISIFKNKKLTMLESMILYLKGKGMKYSEIGKLLNRDQRNIWTIYSRAVKKRDKD